MPKQKTKSGDDAQTGEYRPEDKVPLAGEPAPLPPSPGDAQVEGWFDSQPTFTDPRGKKKRPSARETADLLGDLTSTKPGAGKTRPTRGLLVLVAAAALAVGILIGAITFGHLGAAGNAGADCECAE